MTDKELQDRYLGQKVRIPFHHPMGVGSDNKTITGICKFIGHNPHLPSWGLQLTIGRTPVPNVDETTIEIITNETEDPRTI